MILSVRVSEILLQGAITVLGQPTYRRILLSLTSILLLAASLSVCAQEVDFQLVASNEYLNLYIDPVTTEVAVEDKATHTFWYSNPQDRFSQRGLNLERLSSQFTITHHFIRSGAPELAEKENYRFSTVYEQYDIQEIENGVRIDYTLVEQWQPRHYVPRMISQERMEALIFSEDPEVRAEQESVLLNYYHLIMLAPLGDRKPLEIAGFNHERVFGEYDLVVLNKDYQERERQLEAMKAQAAQMAEDAPERADLESQITKLESQLNKEKTDIIKRLVENLVESRQDIEKSDFVTFQDVAQLVGNPTYLLQKVPQFTLNTIYNVLAETDYTPIECGEDHVMNNLDPLLPNVQIFHIPLEYVLDGPELLVRIPVKDVKYPVDVEDVVGEKHTFPLLTIRVLEYFGAAGKDSEGYMLVPDGSGALINLNNGRLAGAAFNEPVYGPDGAQDQPAEKRRYPEQTVMPVFGIKDNDKALFAVIEEGASFARVRADIAGRINDYNRIFAEFQLLANGRVALSEKASHISFSGSAAIYQQRMYEGDIVIRYFFLTGDDADYIGMADFYRRYLMDKYQLKPLEPAEDVPFFLELVGGIDTIEPILGIARKVIRPLTTFNQAQEILQTLSQQGISNIKLKYLGWLSGGIRHDYPVSVQAEKVLGGAKAFQALAEFAKANGHELYPSVGFQSVYLGSKQNGFNSKQDAARGLNNLAARRYEYWLDTFDRAYPVSWVLSPRILGETVDQFLANYRQYGVPGLALLDLAHELNSDFNNDVRKLVDREQALNTITEQLKKMKSVGYKLMVDYGNSYAVPYADAIVNMPTHGSSYYIVDEEIPFYQIVLHGLVPYAGEPINLAAHGQDSFLKMIETGGYPYFIGSYQESSMVKDTDFAYLYSLHYNDWLELAAEMYQKANAALKGIQNLKIVDHRKLADNVYQTMYENGRTIIVNYNDDAVMVGDWLVGGKDFVVLEGIADAN